MAKPDSIATLQKLGMTGREARLYLALLEKRESTPAELHHSSGVMRTKIYETLEQMVSRGFCMERVENKRRYFRAVNPCVLKDMFTSLWRSEHAWRKEASKKVFGALDERFNRQDPDRSLDFIEVLRSMDQIHRRFLLEVENAGKEILGFNRSPYACLDPDVRDEQEKTILDSLKRGVKSRTIFMMEQDWMWLEEHYKGRRKSGEEIRFTLYLPMKMFIFDAKRVMLALPAVPGQTVADFTMLVVEDPGFTEGFFLLFDSFWNQAATPEAWSRQNKKSTRPDQKQQNVRRLGTDDDYRAADQAN
ncbi:MAG: TrmB family transcriptional regulator [Planctomycetota bacterium]|jgi:sugar-specific transcriptional regulator TrmB